VPHIVPPTVSIRSCQGSCARTVRRRLWDGLDWRLAPEPPQAGSGSQPHPTAFNNPAPLLPGVFTGLLTGQIVSTSSADGLRSVAGSSSTSPNQRPV